MILHGQWDPGVMALDPKIFPDKNPVVTYKCIAEMGDTMDDVTWMTFTVRCNERYSWRALESG